MYVSVRDEVYQCVVCCVLWCQVAEDKTFGLKNKNKSKKVQQYVNNVKGGLDNKSEKERRMELQDKGSNAHRKAKKELAEQRKRELELLFNEAKSSRDMQKVKDLLEKRSEEEVEEKEKELNLDDIDCPIEEWIEQERAKITNRTPLTEAIFKNWRAKQINERAKDAADKRKELSKHGLVSGKEQFERDASLATADDGSGAAFDKYEREIDDEAMLAKAAKEAEILAQRVAAELGISVEELQTGKKKKEKEEEEQEKKKEKEQTESVAATGGGDGTAEEEEGGQSVLEKMIAEGADEDLNALLDDDDDDDELVELDDGDKAAS